MIFLPSSTCFSFLATWGLHSGDLHELPLLPSPVYPVLFCGYMSKGSRDTTPLCQTRFPLKADSYCGKDVYVCLLLLCVLQHMCTCATMISSRYLALIVVLGKHRSGALVLAPVCKQNQLCRMALPDTLLRPWRGYCWGQFFD